jgi:hypothetical protein
MPSVGFEPTIPMFKRAKTVHALDHAATMIGIYSILSSNIRSIMITHSARIFYCTPQKTKQMFMSYHQNA